MRVVCDVDVEIIRIERATGIAGCCRIFCKTKLLSPQQNRFLTLRVNLR